ncbi:MAG: SCO family protein [Pseudomonadota bacterium]
MQNAILLGLAGGLTAVAGGLTYVYVSGGAADPFAGCRAGTVAGGAAAIGGPFELVRHDGQRVTDADVITGPTLMYFGYTYCPDVCPIDTVRNADAVALLDERGVGAVPVMVSVDPNRDTPEVMAEYTSWMHPRMVGLTGTEEEIDAVAKAYKVYYAKNGEGEDYLVDHLTYTYLMAPEHGFLDFFKRDDTAEEIADRVACFAAAL